MKAVILAGGHGTRISEETVARPKPMVEIGNKPILWHIMKIYAAHGVSDFIICCGFKGHMIKEYFANYYLHNSDMTVDLSKNDLTIHQNSAEDWRVTLVDTGADSMTGGRLKRVQPYLDDETFFFTYGDGVGNVDITAALAQHREQGTMATLTAAQPPGRFGAFTLSADQTRIGSFQEKPEGDGAWVNAGYFVLEPGVIDYIEGDHTVWEAEPLQGLAHDQQLGAFKHDGFWQPMDTLRDKNYLQGLWDNNKADWKVW